MKPPRRPKSGAGVVAPSNHRAARLPARRRALGALLVGLACFAVYVTNFRALGAWDSIPARLLPFSIWREGNLDLDEFEWLRRLDPDPYFLRRGGGHWLSRYPVAVPVLVTPLFAPAVWWLQRHQVDDNDARFHLLAVVMERISAALIAAVSVSLLFLALSTLTSGGLAAAIAVAYGLGSSTWTVGSQALWQHGMAEACLAGMSVFLLGRDTRRNAVAGGAFAALAVLARPPMIAFAAAALFFMWRERRRHLPAFLALPVLGATLLFAYNSRFGSVLKGGYRSAHLVAPRLQRLFGLLLSPNRGLFVYTPAAVLALPAMWPRKPRATWLAYLPIGIAGHLLLYTSWAGWWGGHSYGPRFLSEALPAIALCAAPAAERLWRARGWRPVLLALVAWGVGVQAIGAYCDDNSWNRFPVAPGRRPSRLWDWSDPQILRAARAGWHGTDLAPLLWQLFTDPRPVPLKQLQGDDLAGEIVPAQSIPLRYAAGSTQALEVRVTNRSHAMWPAFSSYGYLECRVTYRWWSGDQVLNEAGSIRLPRNLGPGESVRVRGHIDVPAHSGQLELELALVQLLDVNKGIVGSALLRLPVAVE